MASDLISAAEALEYVSAASTPYLAPRSICSRAHAGLIVARAKLLIVGSDRKADAPVPASFWWAEGEEALTQNWATGDFETWLDHRVQCKAYGVEFVRAQIEEMIPSRHQSASTAWSERGNFASASQCRDELKASLGVGAAEAAALLVQHCRAGLIPSRCSNLWWRLTTRYGDEESTFDNADIPDWVWEDCLSQPDAILNWPANLFAGEGSHDGDHYKVKVKGVEFDVEAVVAVEHLAKAELADRKVSEVSTGQSEPLTIGKGRPLNKQWPEWVSELVALVHEEGIPDGEGANGQEELMRKVANALAERGIEGPARSTVQPIVRSVLHRLRSAGK